MKLHGVFTTELQRAIEARLPNINAATKSGLLKDAVYLSRMGVLPEGSNFITEVAPLPTPKPPIVATREIVADRRETTFFLGAASLLRLQDVQPKLAQCVQLAIKYSLVDFRVQQGLRTIEDQKKAVAEGHSRTMHSKHLKQTDGFVWAVDLVVLTGGVVDWTFSHYANIALAMDKAATELGIAGHIRWGCAWDRVLSDFGGVAQAYLDEASAYAKRHAGSDLLDAPHFEWVA